MNVTVPEGHKRSMWVCSTGHITERTSEALHTAFPTKGSLFGALIIYPHEYGWMIWASELPDEVERKVKEYPDLWLLLKVARHNGIDWLNLDCDGETHPDLETYEW